MSLAASPVAVPSGVNLKALPPLALYVHIPWCVRKCPYCDFNSHEARAALPEERYVAALIAEPIQGVGGFTMAPDGLFAAYKEVLDEQGILFISDEVQTGWGRTGSAFFGIQNHGVTPDMMTFAKGLGNGFAVGGVVARGDLLDNLHAVGLATFGGRPSMRPSYNCYTDALIACPPRR